MCIGLRQARTADNMAMARDCTLSTCACACKQRYICMYATLYTPGVVDVVADEVPAVDPLQHASRLAEANKTRLHAPAVAIHIPSPQALKHEHSPPLPHT